MSAPVTSLALEAITHRIFVLRDQKVLLDSDLAALYGVDTRRLNEQVQRAQDTAGGTSCRWPSLSIARS